MSKSIISSSGLSKSQKPHTNSTIESIIDNLPSELLEAMKEQHIVLVGVNEVQKPLIRAIYDAKKQELIKLLRTQLNFRVPESLKISNDETDIIRKDLMFYKRAYEDESTNINTIISSTNILNKQLLEPLTQIKDMLKEYHNDYKSNINKITIPYENKKEGIDKIDNLIKNEENRKEFQSDIDEVQKQMNIYQQQSIDFFKEYSSMNKELSEDINLFIDSFKKLIDSVNELKKEITEGFRVFENSTPEFENLKDKERIKKAMNSIIIPLNKLTELISTSEEMLIKVQENKNQSKQNIGLAQKMMTICEELKDKAKLIAEKINQARLKINLNEIKAKEFDIEPPNIQNIEKNIGEIKEKIEETKKINSKIKEEVRKKTEDFINKSRLDLLFIIDSTNSTNPYLENIKKNLNKMITDIYNNCPTATIYIGFIGYTDFNELDLGDEYIDIELTKDKEEINQKIKDLEPHGGGDEAEDLAGAFLLALNKKWKGFSRFAILATDAPCHGIEFHSPEVEDNYINGDPNGRDIKSYVKLFAEKNISLFCAKLTETTDIMFNIFEKEYQKGKSTNSQCQFTVQSCEDICDIIIQKACQIYKNREISEEK